MNRNIAIAIGVIVLLAGVGIAALPILLPGGTNMTVTFLDADGNEVWIEKSGNVPFNFVDFAFVNTAGADIVSVRVDITWVVTSGDDASQINGDVDGSIVARLNTITGSIVKTTNSDFVFQQAEGTWSQTYQLSDLISVDSQGMSYGWGLVFDYDMVVTKGTDTTSTNLSAGVSIGWSEEALSVTGTIDLGT